jgi:omega-amidase
MQDLKISVIQTHLFWEDIDKNLSHFNELISSINEVDVIVLPEMFSTSFSMNAKQLAEPMSGKSISFLKNTAHKKNAAICASLIIVENDKYYNRFVWIEPNGKIITYDKRHLFSMAQENNHFTAGTNKVIIEYKGWKICPMVCYDLRFPVWSRNRNKQYDCLIYVANWPEVRANAWSALLVARAIENQAYVIGANRIGIDGNNISYSGNSALIDPKGHALTDAKLHEDCVLYASLSYADLQEFRNKFPLDKDADAFEITG